MEWKKGKLNDYKIKRLLGRFLLPFLERRKAVRIIRRLESFNCSTGDLILRGSSF